MPLFKNEPFLKATLPPNLDPEDELYHCTVTNEVFKDYEPFFERMIMVNSLWWSCEMTGQSGLTLEEALASEKDAIFEIDKLMPNVHLCRSILHLIWRTKPTNKVYDIVDDVYDFVIGRYFVGEDVDVIINGKTTSNQRIEEVIIPPECMKSLDNPGQYGSFPDEPSKFKYRVVDSDTKIMRLVKATEMRRPNDMVTKDKLCALVQRSCSVIPPDKGVWKLKVAVYERYRVNEVRLLCSIPAVDMMMPFACAFQPQFSPFQQQPPPTFNQPSASSTQPTSAPEVSSSTSKADGTPPKKRVYTKKRSLPAPGEVISNPKTPKVDAIQSASTPGAVDMKLDSKTPKSGTQRSKKSPVILKDDVGEYRVIKRRRRRVLNPDGTFKLIDPPPDLPAISRKKLRPLLPKPAEPTTEKKIHLFSKPAITPKDATLVKSEILDDLQLSPAEASKKLISALPTMDTNVMVRVEASSPLLDQRTQRSFQSCFEETAIKKLEEMKNRIGAEDDSREDRRRKMEEDRRKRREEEEGKIKKIEEETRKRREEAKEKREEAREKRMKVEAMRRRHEELEQEREKTKCTRLYNFSRGWRKQREDLACDDLRALPVPTTVQIDRIPSTAFSNLVLVLEFYNNFNQFLKDKSGDYFGTDSTLTLNRFCAVLNCTLDNSGFYDILRLIFGCVLKLSDNENNTGFSLKQGVKNNTEFWIEKMLLLHNGAVLGEASEYGQCLDEIGISEIVRAYLKCRLHLELNIGSREEIQAVLSCLEVLPVLSISSEHKLVVLREMVEDILWSDELRIYFDSSVEDKFNAIGEIRKFQRLKSAEGSVESETETVDNTPKETNKDGDSQTEDEKGGGTSRGFKIVSKPDLVEDPESKEKERELTGLVESLRAFSGTRNPLGMDRARRRYWHFCSIGGLFVEYDESSRGEFSDVCIENGTPLEPARLFGMNVTEASNYLKKSLTSEFNRKWNDDAAKISKIDRQNFTPSNSTNLCSAIERVAVGDYSPMKDAKISWEARVVLTALPEDQTSSVVTPSKSKDTTVVKEIMNCLLDMASDMDRQKKTNSELSEPTFSRQTPATRSIDLMPSAEPSETKNKDLNQKPTKYPIILTPTKFSTPTSTAQPRTVVLTSPIKIKVMNSRAKDLLCCTGDKDTCIVHNLQMSKLLLPQWAFFYEATEVDSLVEALNARGFRESSLKHALVACKAEVDRGLERCNVDLLTGKVDLDDEMRMIRVNSGTKKKRGRPKPTTENQTANVALLKDVRDSFLDFKERLHAGGLGDLNKVNLSTESSSDEGDGIDPDDWTTDLSTMEFKSQVQDGDENSSLDYLYAFWIERLAMALKQLGESVNVKFIIPPLGAVDPSTNGGNLFFRQSNSRRNSLDNSQLDDGSAEPMSSRESSNFPKGNLLFHRWLSSVAQCTSISQLYCYYRIFEASIDWSRSLLLIQCRLCKRKGFDEQMLLCDDCDRATHMFCLKPPLKKIPDGEWFCDPCLKLRQKKAASTEAKLNRGRPRKESVVEMPLQNGALPNDPVEARTPTGNFEPAKMIEHFAEDSMSDTLSMLGKDLNGNLNSACSSRSSSPHLIINEGAVTSTESILDELAQADKDIRKSVARELKKVEDVKEIPKKVVVGRKHGVISSDLVITYKDEPVKPKKEYKKKTKFVMEVGDKKLGCLESPVVICSGSRKRKLPTAFEDFHVESPYRKQRLGEIFEEHIEERPKKKLKTRNSNDETEPEREPIKLTFSISPMDTNKVSITTKKKMKPKVLCTSDEMPDLQSKSKHPGNTKSLSPVSVTKTSNLQSKPKQFGNTKSSLVSKTPNSQSKSKQQGNTKSPSQVLDSKMPEAVPAKNMKELTQRSGAAKVNNTPKILTASVSRGASSPLVAPKTPATSPLGEAKAPVSPIVESKKPAVEPAIDQVTKFPVVMEAFSNNKAVTSNVPASAKTVSSMTAQVKAAPRILTPVRVLSSPVTSNNKSFPKSSSPTKVVFNQAITIMTASKVATPVKDCSDASPSVKESSTTEMSLKEASKLENVITKMAINNQSIVDKQVEKASAVDNKTTVTATSNIAPSVDTLVKQSSKHPGPKKIWLSVASPMDQESLPIVPSTQQITISTPSSASAEPESPKKSSPIGCKAPILKPTSRLVPTMLGSSRSKIMILDELFKKATDRAALEEKKAAVTNPEVPELNDKRVRKLPARLDDTVPTNSLFTNRRNPQKKEAELFVQKPKVTYGDSRRTQIFKTVTVVEKDLSDSDTDTSDSSMSDMSQYSVEKIECNAPVSKANYLEQVAGAVNYLVDYACEAERWDLAARDNRLEKKPVVEKRKSVQAPATPQRKRNAPSKLLNDSYVVTSHAVRKTGRTSLSNVEASGESFDSTVCEKIVARLRKHDFAGFFLLPVSPKDVPIYRKIIKKPIDLSTVRDRLDLLHYNSYNSFIKDVVSMFHNCYMFNPPASLVHQSAIKLHKYFDQLTDEYEINDTYIDYRIAIRESMEAKPNGGN